MSELHGKYNEIISALVGEGILTDEKVHYAERVLSKLKGEYKLLDVLKKLQYITDDDIWNAVQKKRVSTRLGNLLVELGYISQQQLESAIEVQKKERENKIAVSLVSGYENISEFEFAQSKALELGYQYMEPDFDSIPPELITKCRPEWYETHRFFPVSIDGKIITVGFTDPSEPNCLDAAKEFFGEDLSPVLVRSDFIHNFISRYKSFVQSGTIFTGSVSVGKGTFQSIISEAIEREGVTDIYIEPMRDRLLIKFRQHCAVRKHQELPPQIKSSLFNYIRESCLDDFEADGLKISHEFHHEKGLFVLSGRILHTRFGDSAIISLRKQEADPVSLIDMPISKYVAERLRNDIVDNNLGLFLICGTESSAKTSLLFSLLKHKKRTQPDSRIAVLEDKPSFYLDDAAFFQADPIGYEHQIKAISDFAPDIMGISGVTPGKACFALLDSVAKGIQTIATQRCTGITEALHFFMDSGTASLLASSLSGVIVQKVMRRICPICVTPISLQIELVRKIGLSPNDLAGLKPMKGVGCKACGNTGYNGQLIATELLIADERLRDAICEVRSSYALKRYITATPGFINLVEDAIIWAGDGQTTIDEIARVFPKNNKTRPFSELQKIRGA
ncbi:GspE/PulE family protein [Desulforegula conservatrix]|uniref:GspE/PulE family protein n=1 Tax=Desulforegula conservatrix TaxID=153026 RepID=UPI0003F8E693|nr:ATPase, T2SS/T4P/T4SS family [Desulforegula conservatrix]